MKKDLTGMRFGHLTVVEKTENLQNRYYTWRCRCDCGNEVEVNTKHLTRGTVYSCGCVPKNYARRGRKAEDLTGLRFGNLTALSRVSSENGRTKWLCRCLCGNQVVVSSRDLKVGHTKSCGCYRIQTLQNRKADIRGQTFGRLTALFPTDTRDEKGSVVWRCRCECGREVETTQDHLVSGHYKSCGCLKKEVQSAINTQLTFVDGTCIEWLKNRKSRRDNTSGHCGVYRNKNGTWKAMIGLQKQRYHIGTYKTYEEAVLARKEAERLLHEGFVKAYQEWKDKAESAEDPEWERSHPFVFRVEKRDERFFVTSEA